MTELRYILLGSREVSAGTPTVLPRVGDIVILNKRKTRVWAIEFVVETCSGEADTVVLVFLNELHEMEESL